MKKLICLLFVCLLSIPAVQADEMMSTRKMNLLETAVIKLRLVPPSILKQNIRYYNTRLFKAIKVTDDASMTSEQKEIYLTNMTQIIRNELDSQLAAFWKRPYRDYMKERISHVERSIEAGNMQETKQLLKGEFHWAQDRALELGLFH